MVVFLLINFAADNSEGTTLATERGLPDDDTHNVPKHVADLLTFNAHIFWCM